MSHPDATTALKIYKTFCRDTEKVVAYLGIAKVRPLFVPDSPRNPGPVRRGSGLTDASYVYRNSKMSLMCRSRISNMYASPLSSAGAPP